MDCVYLAMSKGEIPIFSISSLDCLWAENERIRGLIQKKIWGGEMSTFYQIRWNSLGEGLSSGVGMVSQELQNGHWAQGAKRGDLVWSPVGNLDFILRPMKGH